MKKFLYCFCFLFLVGESVALECPALFALLEETTAVLNLTFTTPVDALSLSRLNNELKTKITTDLQKVAAKQKIKIKKSPRDVEMNAIDFAAWIAEEAISNAAKWGNKFDPKKNITIQVNVTSDKIVVSVRDQGEKAFNPANDPYSVPAKADEGTENAVMARRKLRSGGKSDGYGLFWGDAIHNWEYAYRFESGSHVILAIPWKHVEEN